jgi:hypothetical protein
MWRVREKEKESKSEQGNRLDHGALVCNFRFMRMSLSFSLSPKRKKRSKKV